MRWRWTVADSYQVDPNALSSTAKGINDAIGELKKLGIDESGELGRSEGRRRERRQGHRGWRCGP